MRNSTILALFLLNTINLFGQSGHISANYFDSINNVWKKQITGKPLPTFTAKGEDGTITSANLKGKVTFINFWETGCAPCMAEMQALNKLNDTLKNSKGFLYLSIAPDKEESIKRIKEKYNIAYKVYHLDKDDLNNLKLVMGFPTSMILDKNGNVVYVQNGGSLDNDAIWDYIFGTIYPAILKELSQ